MPNGNDAGRQTAYNATVDQIIRVHDDLAVIRVRPDAGHLRFEPGQYTTLGLGNWEERLAGTQEEPLDPQRREMLTKRAYSISCSMLDREGVLRRPSDFPYLEFYVTLIRAAADHPPALTPRLFAMREGSRLFVGSHAHGTYTMSGIQPDDDLLLAATGTGEAPHNAMLAELLAGGHRGRIALATCARMRCDLAYEKVHRLLEAAYPKYRYLALTTREPENVDRTRADYVGKQYLQDYLECGSLEQALGWRLDPARTHVYLCGSPAMIGPPRLVRGELTFPQQRGMVEVLVARGFKLPAARSAVTTASPSIGNIHFERFW
jgi:ferredoxin/flavodoxin---NADP+ reductase